MNVDIAYSEPGNQVWMTVEVPDGATVRAVIEKSGVLKMFPHIDLETRKVGVFGRLVKLDAGLKPGDRVEIHRPIICDPQEVKRRDGEEADEQVT